MKPLVLLDNGHGNDTPGKRSPMLYDGRRLFEYSWTREVVDIIARMLTDEGIPYRLVTPEVWDVPLRERCQRANRYAEWARRQGLSAILLSVHVNAAGKGDVWKEAYGWSAYTSRGTTNADALATNLYEAASAIFPEGTKLRRDFSDGDADQEAGFYVLKHTTMPAVLTENFFMDCRKECVWLMTDEAKELCARVHVEGIKMYML